MPAWSRCTLRTFDHRPEPLLDPHAPGLLQESEASGAENVHLAKRHGGRGASVAGQKKGRAVVA